MSRRPPFTSAGAPARLGVVVPCRDEARVLERKLANLARCRWPVGGGHRVVVVDDGSIDATREVGERAADALRARPDVDVLVLANPGPAGKAGAVAHGLERVADRDLVVLSDADVVLAPDALVALAAAFDDERVGMACGSQTFVAALASDGTVRAPDGRPPVAAGDVYDRVTARVRALESRFGRLFSVHGQLLAWRASPGLRPRPGVPADDLDLMRAVRASGRRVVRVAAARFYEEKTPPSARADAQALRRARAYVQFARSAAVPPGAGLVDRLQWAFYRRVPLCAPYLLAGAGGSAVAVAAALLPHPAAWATLVVLAASTRARTVRDVLRLARVVLRARRAERREPLSDRWQMERA